MNDHLLSFGVLLAVRLKDGLFVGNAASSRDEEFIESNKITHIINCAGAEVPNYFSNRGISYLTFQWKDALQTVILDPQDQNVDQIFNFMERAFSKGESVLIHSLFGICRSCVVACGYLMRKFRWSLDNSINVMSATHPEMKIKPHFMRQLVGFALRNGQTEDIFAFDSTQAAAMPLESENLLMRNTYLNSVPKDDPPPDKSLTPKAKRKGIKWSEGLTQVAPDSIGMGTAPLGPTSSAPAAPILKGASVGSATESTLSSAPTMAPPPASSLVTSASLPMGSFVVSSLTPPALLPPTVAQPTTASAPVAVPSPRSGLPATTTQNIVLFQSGGPGAPTQTKTVPAPSLSLSSIASFGTGGGGGSGSALPSPSGGGGGSSLRSSAHHVPPEYFSASDLVLDATRAPQARPSGPTPKGLSPKGGAPGLLTTSSTAGAKKSGPAPPPRTLGKTPLRAKQSPTPHARRIGSSEDTHSTAPTVTTGVASATRKVSLDARTGLTKTLAANPMDYLSGSGIGLSKDPSARLAASLSSSVGGSFFSAASTRASVTGGSSARPPSPASRLSVGPTATARNGSPLKTVTRPGGTAVSTSGPLYNNFVGGGSSGIGVSPARQSMDSAKQTGSELTRPSTAVGPRTTPSGINLEAAFDPSKTKSRPKSAPLTSSSTSRLATTPQRASASPGSFASRTGGMGPTKNITPARKAPSPAPQRPVAADDENRLYKPTQSFLSKQVSKSAGAPPTSQPAFSAFGTGRSYF